MLWLYQQQFSDAIYLTSDQYPDRLGDWTRLDHRRGGAKRGTFQAGRFISIYDSLCSADRHVDSVPGICRICRLDIIIGKFSEKIMTLICSDKKQPNTSDSVNMIKSIRLFVIS